MVHKTQALRKVNIKWVKLYKHDAVDKKGKNERKKKI